VSSKPSSAANAAQASFDGTKVWVCAGQIPFFCWVGYLPTPQADVGDSRAVLGVGAAVGDDVCGGGVCGVGVCGGGVCGGGVCGGGDGGGVGAAVGDAAGGAVCGGGGGGVGCVDT